MARVRRLLLLAALVLAVCACGEDAGTQSPTPLMTPTPVAQSVITYVLPPGDVTGMSRTAEGTLNAGAVADVKNDQTLPQRLAAWGFIHGAQAEYSAPPFQSQPQFTVLTSIALLFDSARGAVAYYTEEANRINAIPPGGTLTALDVPQSGVDTLIGYASTQPPANGDPVERAFIVLMRHGAVVAELFASGSSPANTTASAFLPLAVDQQRQLRQAPA